MRSWLAFKKTLRLERIPARSEDPPEYWETEDGQRIQQENEQPFEVEEES